MQLTKGLQERGVDRDLWGTAIGEVEVVQEQVHRHQLPPMDEICQFTKLSNGKIKQQIVVGEKLCLPRCMILLKSSNSCLKTKTFYSRSGPATASLYFRPWEHRLWKMPRLTSKWQTLEKAFTRTVFKEQNVILWYIAACGIKNTKLCCELIRRIVPESWRIYT
jgi:hypothetical protein